MVIPCESVQGHVLDNIVIFSKLFVSHDAAVFLLATSRVSQWRLTESCNPGRQQISNTMRATHPVYGSEDSAILATTMTIDGLTILDEQKNSPDTHTLWL